MKGLIFLITLVVTSIECFSQGQKATQVTEGNVYHEFGYVPMKDGVRLAYVVWRPQKEGRYPTVLIYEPYSADAPSFDLAKLFLESGYAVLGVNFRGSGCSEGTFDFYGPMKVRMGRKSWSGWRGNPGVRAALGCGVLRLVGARNLR